VSVFQDRNRSRKLTSGLAVCPWFQLSLSRTIPALSHRKRHRQKSLCSWLTETYFEKEMAMKNLEGMRVAILATNDFEQDELIEPRRALDEAGAKTFVIAPHTGNIRGIRHDEKGDSVKVDLSLDSANPDDYDAVLIPGGALNADALRVNKHAQEFVRQVDRSGRPIAVICHGPWLLVSAGLARGRKMTSYHTIQDDLRNAGAQWEDREVVRDRNWVSSRQPGDIPAFNREMIALFSEYQEKAREPQRRVA
jgi:protease I